MLVAFKRAHSSTARFQSVAEWTQSEIPVLIPCFNNPTYSQQMLSQLRRFGFRRIIFVNNASSSPEMIAWLRSAEGKATVIHLEKNCGPRHVLTDPSNSALLPRHFCVTDPDILFNPDLPRDFVAQLAALAEREKIGKAGFALDIQDRALMRDESFSIAGKDYKIWDWEKQFWVSPLAPLASGDPVYRADIATTFALYDRNYFRVDDFQAALRVAGRFTAKHLPWYRERPLPANEAALYATTAKFTYYQA